MTEGSGEESVEASTSHGAGDVVLVLAPGGHDGEREACLQLSTIHRPEETAMIWVTFVEGADDRLRTWLDRIDQLPKSPSVIAIGGADRTVACTDPEAVRVEHVRDGRDLPRIGITISTILGELEAGSEPVLCFKSITSLIQFAENDRVYRFLTVLKNRLETSDATGHYHLDPAAVDDETVAALRELCDAVVTVTSDGGIDVER